MTDAMILLGITIGVAGFVLGFLVGRVWDIGSKLDEADFRDQLNELTGRIYELENKMKCFEDDGR